MKYAFSFSFCLKYNVSSPFFAGKESGQKSGKIQKQLRFHGNSCIVAIIIHVRDNDVIDEVFGIDGVHKVIMIPTRVVHFIHHLKAWQSIRKHLHVLGNNQFVTVAIEDINRSGDVFNQVVRWD
jgi:hypothetical protein